MPGSWPLAGCTPSCTIASSAPSTHPTPPDRSPSPPRVSPCRSQRRRPPDDRSPQRPAHPKGKRAPAGTRGNRYEDRRPLGDDEAVREGATARSADPGTVTMLYLCMEVAGCPTVCRHCWAQGTGYGMMPLADIEWVLEGAHCFCDCRGLGFDAYPMHELAAHPDAARLFGLFNAHSATVHGGTMFEPWPTTGVPLAVRDDWRTVLRAAADTGTVNIW